MILYHGSDVIIDKPKLIYQTRGLDFGAGFYTTANKNQAISFASRVKVRNNGISEIVSVYEIDEKSMIEKCNVLRFDIIDENWLEFVYLNRQKIYEGTKYDIVIGAVADDTIYRVFRLYETGILNITQTIQALKVEKTFDQVVFCSEKSLSMLKFKEVINNGK